MDSIARKIAADEIAAHLTIALDALARIVKKNDPRITDHEHTAFEYVLGLCNGCHRFRDFQDPLYASVRLAIIDTPYGRKRGPVLARDIAAFLRKDPKTRLRLAPVFKQVFPLIRAEIIVFGSAYKGLSLNHLPKELATFTY